MNSVWNLISYHDVMKKIVTDAIGIYLKTLHTETPINIRDLKLYKLCTYKSFTITTIEWTSRNRANFLR